ncbi:MAG: hypothetical protein ACPGQV_08190 [Alphaproteobacteria bacterium]
MIKNDGLNNIDMVVTNTLMPGKGGGRISSTDYLETASAIKAVAVFNKPFNKTC